MAKTENAKTTAAQPTRVPIPAKTRTEILLANRHLCCVCQEGYLQIHHINGDPSDNAPDNLAVLCVKHHDMATAPQGMTVRLKQKEVRKYKKQHEEACAIKAQKLDRGRTAFFMVDYKNVERIYQLYTQLSYSERARAVEILSGELQEEAVLRKEQGHSVSIEPTTDWNSTTRNLLQEMKRGVNHPCAFQEARCHPKDTNLPVSMPYKAHHDVWVQLLVRAILTARSAFPIEDLMKLEAPDQDGLSGRLVTLSGNTRGPYFRCSDYEQQPVVRIALIVNSPKAVWRTVLSLKKHYVYSETAAQSLSSGRTHGLVLLRGVKTLKTRGEHLVVDFECTPLILGGGGRGELQIP